jgi:predicted signal transduction protein with EAL and GGDEF domain
MAIYAITAFFVYLVRRHVMHLSMAFSFVISMGAFRLLHSFIDAPTDIVVVVYNFLFLLSTVLIIIGFRAYYKLRIMPRRYYLYLLASVVGIYFFLNIIPDYIGRVSVNTFFLALFLCDALVDARLAIQNEPVKTRRAVYATIGLLLAFFILRLAFVIMTADPTHTLLENLKTTTLTTGFFSVITFNFWLVGSMLLQSDRMIIGLNAKSKKMEDLAMLDPLSKLYNRNKLEVDLEHIVEMSNRSGDIASILLMDIDHFKQINDQLGHDVGDEVLVLTSQIITGLLRTDDQVYRWGAMNF